MSNNAKAGLIITGILIVVSAMVYLVLYGINREDLKTEIPLPSDEAARAYVLEHKLLTTVEEIRTEHPGGPNFKSLQGTDEAGKVKIVWLTGKDTKIKERGSILVEEGLTKEFMLAKLLKEKNIKESDLKDIFIAPYDYTSGRIIWFAKEKDIRGHVLSYDFKTGELLFEIFQDPTAWKL
ncbi:hypothetical protein EHS13_04090 [Paenibacillus psychroresistens]|uniref:DUF5590 domain-containing protein n=1 Tax=Paenibacillus psychroresistens TaxID=1778678 RepID=A0A6B8RF48_9BACL|nr:hypothetical protein [Paenibacillus psychroresistens]QGQ94143.1 hypothetical protein EHS13_04090 [Paenibacillus psychroresistens]